MAAGIETLLRTEGRFAVERVSTGEELDVRDADVVVSDAAFLLEHGGPKQAPTIVLLDASSDRVALEARAPAARAWLPPSATGEELIAAVQAAAPAAAKTGRPGSPAPPIDVADAPARRVAVPDAAVPATARDVAILVFGMACAAVSLSMVWMALRP